jgi:hypothetical protein
LETTTGAFAKVAALLLGLLVGVLFVAAGAGRLYAERRT